MFHPSTRLLALLFCCTLFTFTSCDDDDDPVAPNEEELITDVIYTLVPASGGDPVVFSFTDRDGDGGMDPVVNTVNSLAPNTNYNATIQFQNVEDPTDIEDITAEVLEEADEHQVFYSVGNGLNVTPTYTDTDGGGEPLGLMTTLQTGDSSSGDLTVTLIHEPIKEGDANRIDNPNGVGGSTDVQVVFRVSF